MDSWEIMQRMLVEPIVCAAIGLIVFVVGLGMFCSCPTFEQCAMDLLVQPMEMVNIVFSSFLIIVGVSFLISSLFFKIMRELEE